MDWDPDRIGDLAASVVMLAVMVSLVALVIAGASWAFVQLWPF